jgi:hypothetical protein
MAAVPAGVFMTMITSITRINLAIDINLRLYDFLMPNKLDEKRVEEFLLLANQVYGAY